MNREVSKKLRDLLKITVRQRAKNPQTHKHRILPETGQEAVCESQKAPVVEMSTEGGFGGTSSSDAQQSLQSFWPRVMEEIRNLTVKDFRVQELPLARIKKIMKLDEDVKMISAEAPVLFAKAAQIFITELTLRAWIHTEDNKRRTLQRNDIAMAITKFDQFDFLIDIVPRDELKPPKRQEEVRQSVTPAEPVQYYFTLAQQPTAVQVQGQQQGQQTTSSTTTIQPGQIIIAQPQQGQTTPVTMQVGEGQQVQIVQAQPQGQAQQAQSGTGQTMQVMQQIITNTGEIQQIPVQLNAGQLQYIRLAQPVSGTQVVQGQIQTLATNAQQGQRNASQGKPRRCLKETLQITQTEVQQGQQQFSQFTDGQQLYQIQQVTMPAGQDLAQPMFIQSANQPSDGQAPQVTGD
ncbi:nuclear transcription factor Y subunit gamma isoform X19 [Homo sapiens]|uniref:nuclear transcription factor Y subunit gamma isoform X19 n=1 Tax=Homo sapiens TaxID=9606 RepID=UPI001FB07A32|nr:nuclear transcription factor Y subunit gamma isoform X19 [Homo sapiens]XP_054192759.1 nuclear transcription factor Y subunit gamma isoform X19 [Homo sapiens]